MKLPLFQVDAFASRVFAGNPAAVVPLERWLDDATLQQIATENNLSETAFFVGGSGDYHIRWMTPAAEIDLCGHATLASAWIVFNASSRGGARCTSARRAGPCRSRRRATRLALDFPSRAPEPAEASLPAVADALGARPVAAARLRATTSRCSRARTRCGRCSRTWRRRPRSTAWP